MRARCELQLNGTLRKMMLSARDEETDSHLALKLLGICLYWNETPLLDAGPRHVAMANWDFYPDLLCTNEYCELSRWIECGRTPFLKLNKLSKRVQDVPVTIIAESPFEGERILQTVTEQVSRPEKISIVAFPKGEFARWAGALEPDTCVVGDCNEKNLNVVFNSEIFDLSMVTIKK
ncbi:MAG: YaeQ family protein [Elusimicrobiaceae bacterium]|nr:YaeQ family protein [Elusimicrobiaceae bacterium]